MDITITADHIRELNETNYHECGGSDDPDVLVIEDGDIFVTTTYTAHELGADIVCDASQIYDFTDGVIDEFSPELYAQFAHELNVELSHQ